MSGFQKASDYEVESLLRYLHQQGIQTRKVTIENIGGTRVAKVEKMDGSVSYFSGIVRMASA